jgi:SseB protein N-terminal domain
MDGVDGAGRTLAAPAFPDDDGAALPWVRDLVWRAASGEIPILSAARALRGARLLATVVAVLDEVDESGADKDSHMAVVFLLSDDGRRGLLAFTGVDAVGMWRADARPVPALGRDLARAAEDDGSMAVIVDVAGPVRLILEGVALEVLRDELDMPDVCARVEAVLAGLTSDGWVTLDVRDVRADDLGVDVLVTVTAPAGGHPDGRGVDQLAQQAGRLLSTSTELTRLVPGGLGIAAG